MEFNNITIIDNYSITPLRKEISKRLKLLNLLDWPQGLLLRIPESAAIGFIFAFIYGAVKVENFDCKLFVILTAISFVVLNIFQILLHLYHTQKINKIIDNDGELNELPSTTSDSLTDLYEYHKFYKTFMKCFKNSELLNIGVNTASLKGINFDYLDNEEGYVQTLRLESGRREDSDVTLVKVKPNVKVEKNALEFTPDGLNFIIRHNIPETYEVY